MVDTPTDDQQCAAARAAMRECEDHLAAAIVAYGQAVKRRWGGRDPVDPWEDLGRFGKWRPECQ